MGLAVRHRLGFIDHNSRPLLAFAVCAPIGSQAHLELISTTATVVIGFTLRFLGACHKPTAAIISRRVMGLISIR